MTSNLTFPNIESMTNCITALSERSLFFFTDFFLYRIYNIAGQK